MTDEFSFVFGCIVFLFLAHDHYKLTLLIMVQAVTVSPQEDLWHGVYVTIRK